MIARPAWSITYISKVTHTTEEDARKCKICSEFLLHQSLSPGQGRVPEGQRLGKEKSVSSLHSRHEGFSHPEIDVKRARVCVTIAGLR